MKSFEELKIKRWMKLLPLFGFICIDSGYSSAQEAKVEEKAVARSTELFPEKEVYTRAEVEALHKVLEQKSDKLDQDIETQKEYIESLKKQVQDHLAKIDSARTEIADFMNARDEKEENKLKKLARFYEAMDAEQAAPHLQKVNDELAIKIFDRMDTKKAGAILALYPNQRAAIITAAFPRLKIQADKGQIEDAN